MEDQTLNPFRAPIAGGRAPRTQPALEAVILEPVRWHRELPVCLSLFAMILVAYWGVWLFDFVYFDDPGYVTDNLNVVRGLPLFKDFKGFCASIYWAFTAFEQSNWHPLTWLSHMLDVQIYGLNAGGHHVTNIIFHVSNTLLLFWLLRWLTGRCWCSAAVATFFAVHPMHVESVVWVAERKDVLSTFLGLLTLFAYVRYGKNPSVSRYIPVFVLLALGLLAKPMLITFPCVCLLLDYWPLGRLKLSGEADAPVRRAPPERPAVPRRKPKRNQRLPQRARTPQVRRTEQRPVLDQVIRLVVEKIPLFFLSAISAVLTPYAQNHGGSMASASELPILFRIENSMQSYLIYITKLFWPGKMMSLHLLVSDEMGHPYVEPRMIALSIACFVFLTAVAIAAFFYGRHYVTFGWFWYVGTLVPVIGFVQVGEQGYADRYTYIPFIGLFVAIVWAIAELLDRFSSLRRLLVPVVSLAVVAIVGVWICWTNYQIQTWRDVKTHLLHALDVEPDNWNMLNNYGVWLWKQAQEQDVSAAKAEAEGDLQTATACRQQAFALKDKAMSQWNHGITARPTATDIHSNLGYAYSEASERDKAKGNFAQAEKDLDEAERHLRKAVELKPISPRPHNNLGRVLLRRNQECEAKAAEAEAKGKTDPVEAAKVKPLKELAKTKLDDAIREFEEAVRLDPSLLEARLNLGEVYMSLSTRDKTENDSGKAEKDLDKAESEYREILKLDSPSVKDRETINNFSQAYFGLARVALARKDSGKAIESLQKAVERNSQNVAAMQLLALQWFERGEFREGEKCLWPLLAVLAIPQRRVVAESFGKQFEAAGKGPEALRAWNFMAWAFATSPDPHILDPETATVWAGVLRIKELERLPDLRDPQAALHFAQLVVGMTKQQDPVSVDTLAAAQAASGQFGQAVKTAQIGIDLANSQGKKELAKAISQRLPYYQKGKPYPCDPNGSDRP
jgi:tetratricopeptide (TPR) repeat protein